jgi:hypothetical protein
VIPADTRNKKTWISWSHYQDRPILKEQHEQWKKDNTFQDGMTIIPGKVWHNMVKKGLLGLIRIHEYDTMQIGNSRGLTISFYYSP